MISSGSRTKQLGSPAASTVVGQQGSTTSSDKDHQQRQPHQQRVSKPFDPYRQLYKYALSCAAATVAETVTYPLDLTKTRLQVQGANFDESGELISEKHRGMFSTARRIVLKEGVFMLWQGLTPAVLRHYVYTGIRVNAYEILRQNVLKLNPDGSFPIWKAMISGVTSGAFAQLVASPTDLIKVQMQMAGYRDLKGLPPRFNGVWDAVRGIVREGGVRALWKGWVPNCQRAALVNMADLATYDTVKHYLLKRFQLDDDWRTHMMASSFSGLAAATASTPADVVKTRVMNQPTDDRGRGLLYRSSADCLMQTVKQEGFQALYKGFVPIWARMAPWSLTFWVSYEEIRRIAGASSF